MNGSPETFSQAEKDAATAADLAGDALRSVLTWMLLTRATEERLIRLYRQGQIIGGVYAGTGQEAIGACAAAAAKPQDLFAPCIRNMSLHIARGESLLNVFRQWLGRENGPTRGRDGNVHFGTLANGVYAMISHLGAMIPVVAGGVMAKRRRGEDSIGFAFIGDGGTSTGDFHEGVNFAAVNDVPLIVVVENNHYAYSTPTNLQYKCKNLIDRAAGYGIEGHSVDGNNAPQLFALLNRIAEDIRKSPRTVMVECDTMRMRGHGEHDDARYVPSDLLAEYKARDPIQHLREYMAAKGIMSETDADALKADCIELVRTSYKQAVKEAPPSPGSLLEGIYPHE